MATTKASRAPPSAREGPKLEYKAGGIFGRTDALVASMFFVYIGFAIRFIHPPLSLPFSIEFIPFTRNNAKHKEWANELEGD